MLSPDALVQVQVERRRSALCVSATLTEGAETVRAEATFSGGADGVWLKLQQGNAERVFSRELVASQPPLAAILRLIGDEAELGKSPSTALLGLLFRSLLVYVSRMTSSCRCPAGGARCVTAASSARSSC